MKVVRALAAADASALPGLRRALSPESIELVGVASTPASVLARVRRVCPDVVVVDLSLSQCDVFHLITQLVQGQAVVLALASGDEAAGLAERAHAAGASDVVQRRTAAGSWHEESGSPHVLSLRVLALAASARPRPSKLSLRLSRPASLTSPVPQLSAADSPSRTSAPSLDRSSSLRASPVAPSSPEETLSASAPDAAQTAAGLSHRTVSSGPVGLSSSMRALGLPPTAASLSVSQAARMSMSRADRLKTGLPLMASQVELVAIGASTGGTLAIADLLKTMPETAPPMFVVQHMLPEFTNDFAQRLNELCELHVRVAVDGELVKPGTVLLAPGGRHLRVMRDAEQRLRARVTDELPVGKHRPSVDVLFRACAETLGSAAVGVLLTGMGDDGARGLLALHNSGARTLVQDQASCVCFGMPSAAIALGAAQQILPLRDIAHALRELIKPRESARV